MSFENWAPPKTQGNPDLTSQVKVFTSKNVLQLFCLHVNICTIWVSGACREKGVGSSGTRVTTDD